MSPITYDELVRHLTGLHPAEWHHARWTIAMEHLPSIATVQSPVTGAHPYICRRDDPMSGQLMGLPVDWTPEGTGLRVAVKAPVYIVHEGQPTPDFRLSQPIHPPQCPKCGQMLDCSLRQDEHSDLLILVVWCHDCRLRATADQANGRTVPAMLRLAMKRLTAATLEVTKEGWRDRPPLL